ncbi:hypothetical protein Tco_0190877 [Tanacetum coccineum]
MVAATEPMIIQKAVQKFGTLTNEAIRNGSLKKNPEQRGNSGEPSRDRNVKDNNKRTRTENAFATTTNSVRREYTGAALFLYRVDGGDFMRIVTLDEAMAEVLGMTDLQPDVGQLMVPVHHRQDKVVIGSQTLSVVLETYHRRVRKMERNLAKRLFLLRDVFFSINHPVSTEALAILPETSTKPLVTVLVTTTLSTMVIPPNPDPFLLVEDYENLDLTGMVPVDVIPGSKGEGNVEGSPTGDAGDVFSHLENEARDAVL